MFSHLLSHLVWKAHQLSIFDVGIIFLVLFIVIAYPAIRDAWNGGR